MTEVKIESLGQRGDGLAKLNGATLHVPKVLPGEVVELSGGKLVRVVTPSHERVEAFCQHYAQCGGCKFQHWAAAPYAAWKRNMLVQALAARDLEPQIAPLVDAHGEGRRRVSLHVRAQGGTWAAGFMEQKSHDLCALDHCPVLVPALANAPHIAAAFGPGLGACDVAITAADNGLDVSVKAERKIVLRRLEAMNVIMRHHAILRLTVNGEVHTALGTPMVNMGKANVPLPLQSFLQATGQGEAVLALHVLDGLKGCKSVADLFCGVGPFALRLAEHAKIYAADSDKPAIASLQQAMRNTQGLKPITPVVRDLFREPLTIAELNSFDGVVFDPPRAGAEAQARMLAKSKVKRIVAVACDVANFARDAEILVKGGYALKSVTPVDQFKYTSHLEMVGVFQR